MIDFPIRDSLTYSEALKAIERLMRMNPKAGSLEAEELIWYADRVAEYEERTFQFPEPTAEERAAFRREQELGV